MSKGRIEEIPGQMKRLDWWVIVVLSLSTVCYAETQKDYSIRGYDYVWLYPDAKIALAENHKCGCKPTGRTAHLNNGIASEYKCSHKNIEKIVHYGWSRWPGMTKADWTAREDAARREIEDYKERLKRHETM